MNIQLGALSGTQPSWPDPPARLLSSTDIKTRYHSATTLSNAITRNLLSHREGNCFTGQGPITRCWSHTALPPDLSSDAPSQPGGAGPRVRTKLCQVPICAFVKGIKIPASARLISTLHLPLSACTHPRSALPPFGLPSSPTVGALDTSSR